MRQYIRHPSNVPISCKASDGESNSGVTQDVSMGGLCFRNTEPLESGARVQITIDITDPPFEADAVVVWCKETDDHYDVGIKFECEATEMSVRMVEQICHIEFYREEVFKERGEELTTEEAAREWIEKYASNFPA